MKKRFLIFSLLFLALIIVSCGGSSNNNSDGGGDDNGTGDNSGDNSGDGSGDNSGGNGGGEISDAVCGNRTVETGEVCDGGATECSTIDSGYTGGYAVCKADCKSWDTSACSGTPSNPTDPSDPNPTYPSDDDDDDDPENNEDPRYDTNEINYIHLKGNSIEVDGKNVSVSGTTATITASGLYEIDGTLNDGQILVDVDKDQDEEMVHVVLNGVNITNSKNSPFAVMGAKDVRIFTAKDTQNYLTDAANYVFENGADEPDAALFSKSDLRLAGEGTLTVKGNYNDGVTSKDDLDIDGGTLIVNAKDDGLRGKDSVVIRRGNVTVTSGGDGIKSDNTDALTLSSDPEDLYENIRGYIKIKEGTVTVTSTGGDALHAISFIEIENGNIDIMSGGGSIIEATSGSSGGGWGGGGGPNGGAQHYTGDTSLKGIKASVPETVADYENINKTVVYIKISGGTIKVNSRDDAIHCGGNIEIKGGDITIASDDDGIHSDNTLLIINGSINVTNSFEGLEAQFLEVNGGITSVFGRDDGWNAAGGSDGSGMGGGPGGHGGPGGGGFGSSSGTLTLTGGIHYVKTGSGDVDGIDSNGALTISDQAVIVVECQISGGMGGSYDADGTTNLTSPWILGFTPSQNSERGQNYSVNFNTNAIYGNQKVAFQPTFSGSRMQSSSGQPSMISDVSGYTAQTMPNGVVIYYQQ